MNNQHVIVFDTWKDIEKKLKPYLDGNLREYSRLQSANERRNAPTALGNRLQFTYLMGLFASEDGQFFSSGSIQDLSECEGDQEYSTIEALAEGVKKGISDTGKNYSPAWIVPFFYTIRDAHTFSEDERRRIDESFRIFQDNLSRWGVSFPEQENTAASPENISVRGLSELERTEFERRFYR